MIISFGSAADRAFLYRARRDFELSGDEAVRATQGDYFKTGKRQERRRRKDVRMNTEVRNVDEAKPPQAQVGNRRVGKARTCCPPCGTGQNQRSASMKPRCATHLLQAHAGDVASQIAGASAQLHRHDQSPDFGPPT
jgi:hypothetical protein